MIDKHNKPLTLDEVKKFTPAQIAECVKVIDSWSGDRLKENCSDPEFAEVIEYILSVPPVAKDQPKSEPKPRFKAPVRTQEEQLIESMSADDLKRAIAKGRGPAIVNILSRRKS